MLSHYDRMSMFPISFLWSLSLPTRIVCAKDSQLWSLTKNPTIECLFNLALDPNGFARPARPSSRKTFLMVKDRNVAWRHDDRKRFWV